MKQLSVLIILLTAIASIAQPLGDVIGTTYLLNQSSGPSGNRIAVCDDGSIYACWTKLLGWPNPTSPRHIYYNWRSPEGEWYSDDGSQVSENSGAGYCNLDIIYGNRGCFTYHYDQNVIIAIEWNPPGMGVFYYFNVPNEIFPQTPDYPGICLWPQITIDRNDNINLFMTENTNRLPRRLGYTRSEDGGNCWTDVSLIDTMIVICGLVVSSPVSDRVAIAYLHPYDTTSQLYNWPKYAISDDGQNWDFDNDLIDVPYPYPPNFDLWAYADLEAIFDYNDELHLAWPVYGEGWDWLLHYREGADTIETICQIPDTTINHPIYSLLIDQVSLSRRENTSALFATWCQYAVDDTNTAGEYNGDIYFSRSIDNGMSWQEVLNITNSPSPNCEPGDCMSELFPCAAEEADSLPHITYIYNPFISPDPGPNEILSVMYLGPDHLVGIEQPPNKLPSSYCLSQNFPNPFNVSTTIRYNLPEQSYVIIEVYNILGQKVKSLLSEEQPAGYHTIEWQAGDFASGLYFYKIQAGDYVQTKGCLLLK